MKNYTCIGSHMINGVAYEDGAAVGLNDQDAHSFRALGFVKDIDEPIGNVEGEGEDADAGSDEAQARRKKRASTN